MSTILSYPDNTLQATLSGGSWTAGAPLANLLNRLLKKIARSTNALAASTLAQADLGAAKTVRIIAVCAHNISAAGTIRVRGYSDAGYTTMVTGADTGTVNAWPAGFTATDVANSPKNWTFCLPASVSARYWKLEIVDTGNAAGYIELGRWWLGAATFSPVVGVSYGMGLGYESRDIIDESIGGVVWGEQRTPRRALTASFDTLSAVEKRQAFTLQRVLTGVVEAYWVSLGEAIADDMLHEAFPCFVRKASPLQYPYFGVHEFPIEIIECI